MGEIEEYKSKYQADSGNLTSKQVELEELNIKLRQLSSNISNVIKDNTLQPQTLINVLDMIEAYTVLLEDDESKDMIEIMFFEGILNTLSDIREDNPNYRYVSLFKNNLGPASEELCEKNNAFWKKVMNPQT